MDGGPTSSSGAAPAGAVPGIWEETRATGGRDGGRGEKKRGGLTNWMCESCSCLIVLVQFVDVSSMFSDVFLRFVRACVLECVCVCVCVRTCCPFVFLN